MKQTQFLEVLDRDEAEARFRKALGNIPSPVTETVALAEALGRVGLVVVGVGDKEPPTLFVGE